MAQLLVRGRMLILRLNIYEKLIGLTATSPKIQLNAVEYIFPVSRVWSEVLEPEKKTHHARAISRGLYEMMPRTRAARRYVTYTRSRTSRGRSALSVYGDRPAVVVDIRKGEKWGLFAVTSSRASEIAKFLWAEVTRDANDHGRR